MTRVQHRSKRRVRTRERGTAVVEFALGVVLFWIPLFLGSVVIGFNLIRAVQVTQVARDAGHMYASGIDFSQATYQNLLVDLAVGLNMTTTGGSGVVYLSTVAFITASSCTSGGLQADSTHCPNLNTTVFTQQIVIGNSSLGFQSTLGSPNPADMDSSGNVSVTGQLTDTANQIPNFQNLIPCFSSSSSTSCTQIAYVSEMFETSPVTGWWFSSTPSISARSIF